ncbi:MAG TPA: CidA/LrgA family protein [Burkholderiaceae bacterium]|nr:CidA/LrgA family protein [Burkholderiaceae bacterium]
MLNALAVLLVFQLMGEVVVQWLDLPIPGPLIGMLLLFAVLTIRRRVPDWLRDTATGILQHLMLLFIPAVTGVILYFEQLGDDWVAFVVAGIVGTAISIVVTALTLRLMLARRKVPSP